MSDIDQKSKEEIQKLIEIEDNKTQRTLLIILNNINESIIANTSLMRDYSNSFNTHLEDYKLHKDTIETKIKKDDEQTNKIKGASKVIIAVTSVLQVVIFSVFISVRDDNSLIHEQINKNILEHQKISDRVNIIEIDITKIEDKIK